MASLDNMELISRRIPGLAMSWDGPNMEFPEIRGTLFWGPYNKVPTVWGTYYISVPIFGNSHIDI